ncbi:hypothetical protein GCM10022280_26350 [Sphingomonas swuensis]|uniref:Uncharacterized protein n=1 Tax=Sphingomonas swuensis TaxID=977800 RepID=A0ABP7TC98_9SPHN
MEVADRRSEAARDLCGDGSGEIDLGLVKIEVNVEIGGLVHDREVGSAGANGRASFRSAAACDREHVMTNRLAAAAAYYPCLVGIG